MNVESLSYIESLHNLHNGWNCFIVGNSPSLNELSIEQKNKIYRSIIIGTNSSYKILTSQYHWFVHSDLNNLTKDDINFLYTTIIPTFNIETTWEKHRFKNSHYLNYLGGQGWSNDLLHGIYCAFTVVHAAIQFGAWLGCKTITLIGCDFAPINNQIHFETKSTESDELIHWQGMNQTVTQCIEPLNKLGIKLFNASPYYKYNTIDKITL